MSEAVLLKKPDCCVKKTSIIIIELGHSILTLLMFQEGRNSLFVRSASRRSQINYYYGKLNDLSSEKHGESVSYSRVW